MKHAVYRHFNASDDLLYVGCSANPFGRFAHHKSQSKWAHDVTRVDIQWFDDRSKALAGESAAIRSERPKHNVIGLKPIVRRAPQSILSRLGYMPASKALNVPISEVEAAAKNGRLPSAWYAGLCELAGQDLPRHLFTFKGIDA